MIVSIDVSMTVENIIQLLDQARLGNKSVLNEAYELLYAEIKSIAGFYLKQLTPENKRHFLNYLSRMTCLYVDVFAAIRYREPPF